MESLDLTHVGAGLPVCVASNRTNPSSPAFRVVLAGLLSFPSLLKQVSLNYLPQPTVVEEIVNMNDK